MLQASNKQLELRSLALLYIQSIRGTSSGERVARRQCEKQLIKFQKMIQGLDYHVDSCDCIRCLSTKLLYHDRASEKFIIITQVLLWLFRTYIYIHHIYLNYHLTEHLHVPPAAQPWQSPPRLHCKSQQHHTVRGATDARA